jgi:signal transduction histidine kinase
LVSSGLWHLDDPEPAKSFRKVSESCEFSVGEDFPGRVLASGKPRLEGDIVSDPNFRRASLAAGLGIRSAFGIPIIGGGAGVMEFFAPAIESPDAATLETMSRIGSLLGRLLERRQNDNETGRRAGKTAARGADRPGDAVCGEPPRGVGNQAVSLFHEVNSPVLGLRKLLRQLAETAAPRENRGTLFDLAVRKCARIGALAKALKDICRPHSGISGPMNVHEAIDDLLLLKRQSLAEKNIEIETRYASGLPPVEAVHDQILRAILGILSSIEKSTPAGGGKILIATEGDDAEIRIHFQGAGGSASPERDGEEFESFSREDFISEYRSPLQYSLDILKTHGGHLAVNGGDGKTRYTVTLPVNTAS